MFRRRVLAGSRGLSARASLVTCVATLALLGALPAAAHAAVKVWFAKGEQLVSVPRPGSTAQEAVTALLAGPTASEAAKGLRTYVPGDTTLRAVTVADGTATVDLGLTFATAQHDDADSLRARLAQVVRTLTGPQGARRVRLRIEGGIPLGLFPGVTTSVPLTVDYLNRPDAKPPTPAQTTPPKPAGEQPSPSVLAVQQRLIELGYLLPGDADGRDGPATQAAVMAFQKWERLSRDGAIGPQTSARVKTAARPTPRTKGGAGRRVEVLLDRQVALAIENDRVVRTLHVSTGAAATPTPPGDFRVYGKFEKWWSVPFREWLLWAGAFNGGIAFHQLASVPPVPASHGCVRLTASQARWLFDFISVGTRVKVITSS